MTIRARRPMAIAQRAALSHCPTLLNRLQTLVIDLQRCKHTFVGDGGSPRFPDLSSNPVEEHGSFDISTWKILDSGAVGIRRSDISSGTWTVLQCLQRNGFEVYLVGGCVRDLILKKTPKDFDVITTASLKQVKKQFNHCIKVGRRFPICQVFLRNSMIEVSSFSTRQENVADRQTILPAQVPNGFDKKDFVRWNDSLKRDFTINGLFYDPFVGKVYDYVNGIRDLRTSKVRTVIPAHLSFKEDCARILRGLRIAARLGLQLSKETEAAITDLSSSIISLDKQRLMMELNFMLAYGAARSSLHLLQKFKLLDIFLPVHAAYLADQTRKGYDECSTMLMRMFSSVDKLLAADRPSDSNLWLALLSFHLALLYHPQEALVVQTLSSILYHGTWTKAVRVARESSEVHVQFSPEILAPLSTKSDDSLLEKTSNFASLIQSSSNILTNAVVLRAILAKQEDPPPVLDLIFVPKKKGETMWKLFGVLASDIKSYAVERKTCDINYELLKKGDLNETRFVLGKIIMDTMKEEAATPAPKQNPNTDAMKSNLWDLTCKENTNAANKRHVYNYEQNEKVAGVRKCWKHTCEGDQIVGAKSKWPNPNLNAAESGNCDLGEITIEESSNMVALKKDAINELTDGGERKVGAESKSSKQNRNVTEPGKTGFGEFPGGESSNVVALKKDPINEFIHEGDRKGGVESKSRNPNRNAAEPGKYSYEQNKKVAATRKSWKHTHEAGRKVGAESKSLNPNQNVSEPGKSCQGELTGEENLNAVALKEDRVNKLTREQNQRAASMEKRQPLSALFK